MTSKKPTGKPTGDSMRIAGLQRELRFKFKRRCERDNIPMTEAIGRFMRLVIDENSPLWQDILHQPPVEREFRE